MERSKLVNLLLVLLILVGALFLAQMLWQLLSSYSDILLLFVLGWLVSFILKPIISFLTEQPLHSRLIHSLISNLESSRAKKWVDIQLPRGVAVALVYLLLVIGLVVAVSSLVPPMVEQLSELASHLPEYAKQAPAASEWVQTRLERLGLKSNVEEAVRAGLSSLQSFATTIIQNALGIFTGVLGFVANLFFVLILSFYFALDEPRLRKNILGVIPGQYHNQARFFAQSVDRTFGGFIRGQLVQAVLVGIGTAIVMVVLGLDYILVAGLFAGLFMLIPLVGPALALIPPLFAVLLHSPSLALVLLAILFVYQFVIVNVLMPRILSDAVGMHPLLVLGALLISIRVAGFWGAFFGIPVAGVLWAMVVFMYEEWQRTRPASGK